MSNGQVEDLARYTEERRIVSRIGALLGLWILEIPPWRDKFLARHALRGWLLDIENSQMKCLFGQALDRYGLTNCAREHSTRGNA